MQVKFVDNFHPNVGHYYVIFIQKQSVPTSYLSNDLYFKKKCDQTK